MDTTNTSALQTPSSTYSTGMTSPIEDKALSLLGSGVSSEAVASALGVTASRISQLLSNKEFAGQVAELRYDNLQSHNVRDGKYDAMEDRLLDKLEKSMPLMVRPEIIMRAMSIVNGAKRRGQSTPEQVTNAKIIVNLILPKQISQKFVTNINNQVTRAGEQELLTMSSGNLLKQVEDAEIIRVEQLEQLEHSNGDENANRGADN